MISNNSNYQKKYDRYYNCMQNIEQSLTFLLWQFIEAVLIAFVVIAFIFFVGKSSITNTISSHSFTEVSATLFKYLLFSKIHVLGF